MEAWAVCGRRFVQRTDLPDWPAGPCWRAGEWRFLLPPGWRALAGRSLADVAAFQYARTYDVLLDDISALEPGRWCTVRYADLLADPESETRRILDLTGLAVDEEFLARVRGPLPCSPSTVSAPAREKWRTREEEIRRVAAVFEPVASRLEALHRSVRGFAV